MPNVSELDQALATINPSSLGTYVFALVDSVPEGVDAFAIIRDENLWTVVVPEAEARRLHLPTDDTYERISLGLTSALAAVGVTASIAQILSARSITANFVASNRHNHLFVQKGRAQETLALLTDLGRRAKGYLPL
ncbi:ACT domain-containing protein [Schaalia suimastitidis]|uniref:ACT domain-containing protein n=1 Tax=Schaalia suimastitidis TaxID=121163 RepID=UPI00041EEE56|nr:ACT domain-containing protein [Schaalia suimastitidis]